MNRVFFIIFVSFVLLLFSPLGLCCDLCAVYNSVQSTQGEAGSVNVGVSHQFTHFESNVKPIGNVNAPGQHVESNVTQFFGNYLISDRFSFQINLPLIYRSFRRVSFGRVEEGTEKGLGDISGLAKWRAWQSFEADTSSVVDFFGGLKLPTGSSDRLRDELPGSFRGLFRHGGPGGSLVSGDLLALGTGSVDPFIGGNLFFQKKRWFVNGNWQYQHRTTGRFDYRYGNDFQFAVAPGAYLILEDEETLGVGVRFSGELKESNRLNGSLVPDSAERNLFLGGFTQYTLGDSLFMNLSLEFPTLTESASEEVLPRYRLQAALSIQF